MKKRAVWLALALAWICGCGLQPALALEYKTVDIRKTGSSPMRETFWAGDSIAFGYALEEDSDAYDLDVWDMVSWELCTYTNPAECWMGVTGRVDDAYSGELSVETTLPLSVVPEGQYRGYVKGLKLVAGETNVASQRVLVEQVVTVRYGQTEFPPDVEDNEGIVTAGHYVRQEALDAEAEARIGADAALSNAVLVVVADVDELGNAVTVISNAVAAIGGDLPDFGDFATKSWTATNFIERELVEEVRSDESGGVVATNEVLVVYYDQKGQSLYVKNLRVQSLTDYNGNLLFGNGVGGGAGGTATDFLPAVGWTDGWYRVSVDTKFLGGVEAGTLAADDLAAKIAFRAEGPAYHFGDVWMESNAVRAASAYLLDGDTYAVHGSTAYTNVNGLAQWYTQNRSYPFGLVLHSQNNELLMAVAGGAAAVDLRKSAEGEKAMASVSAEGAVSVSGESVTLEADAGDGRIALDGDVSASGDVEAATFTLGGVTIDEWPSGGGDGDYLPATREDEGEPWSVEDEVAFYGGVRLDRLAMGESAWTNLPTLADLNKEDELADELEKYGANVDGDDAWDFRTPNVPMWQGTNLATTADVGRVAADVAENARGVASNRIGVAKVNDRIEELWGECRGGWRWPDYFLVTDYYTGWRGGGTTNVSPPYATNTVYNVVETLALQEGLSGWNILTKTIRKANESDSIVWEPIFRRRGYRDKVGGIRREPSIDPDLLETSGSVVSFKEGVTIEDVDAGLGRFAAVKGTLGDYTVYTGLDFDREKQATNSTLVKFVGPAPGSFLAHCYSNILVAASNAAAQGKGMGLWLWPQGYGSGTNHVPATINTNCWVYGMGDFSCVSYHTDTRPDIAGGTYRPLVMVTPRHAVCANHFKPLIGSNVYWVTKSGTVATNRVESYYNIRSDLTIARLERPFDTNQVGTATLLQNDFYHYVYGSTNYPVHEMLGIPCLSFDCAERVRVNFWRPTSLWYGPGWTDSIGRGYDYYAGGYSAYAYNPYVDDEDYHGPYRGNGTAVGGDSGSPSFLIANGKCILLGCFYTAPGSGPKPDKYELDEVIENIWNDPERCEEYSIGEGGWTNPDAPAPPH